MVFKSDGNCFRFQGHMFFGNVTKVRLLLHCCQTDVTLLLHRCYTVAPVHSIPRPYVFWKRHQQPKQKKKKKKKKKKTYYDYYYDYYGYTDK
jgi:hypothetical protein